MRVALTACVLLAVGLLLWWASGRDRERSERAPRTPVGLEERDQRSTAPRLESEQERGPDAGRGTDAPAPQVTRYSGKWPPPDPVEQGECELFLRLVDADSGLPVASTVDLWRLNAPGNDCWTAGDQRQLTQDVGEQGALLTGLPEGTYRAFCLEQRVRTDDPAAFPVAGPSNSVTLELPMPREFHLRVRVVDERGLPIESARISRQSWTSRAGSRTPEWRTPRRLRVKPPENAILGIGGGAGGAFGGRTRETPQPSEGYRLGPFKESAKVRDRSWTQRIYVENRGSVIVRVSDASADTPGLVAVAPSTAWLVWNVRLPNGLPVLDAGATVSASSEAVPLDRTVPGNFWLHIPIEVTVTLAGYRRLDFETHLWEHPPVHVLEPQ